MTDEIDRILAAHRKELDGMTPEESDRILVAYYRKELDAFKAKIEEVERKIDLIEGRLRMPPLDPTPDPPHNPPARGGPVIL